MNMPPAKHEVDQLKAVVALLEDDAVRAVYQPIVRLLDGAVVGYEALARMKHLPYRPPDQWLALAEEAGLGDALELMCLKAAAAAGAPPNDSLLFVNVSPKWLADPANLAARAWLPDRLVLELSERDAVEEYAALRDAMFRWKADGARIAVDDMGSGWPSIRHVIQLRPDFIKIDRSLIDHIDTDRSKRALTCALVAFGREAGCAVIAEGIERREELDALLEADVAYAQDYLLARPAAAWPSCATLSSWSPDEATTRPDPRRLGLAQRLQRAADCRDACEAVSEHLWRLGSLMPSVYLERGGVLRCIAQRGLWQVLDGMPVGVGITGRVFELGEAIRLDDVRRSADYLEAIPGVVAEMCVPVFVDGKVAGALNVESYASLTDDAADEVIRCASLLGHRLSIVGAAEEESSSQRLARPVVKLAEVTEEHLLETALLDAAIDLSGLASAALVRLDDKGMPYLARVTGSDAEAFGLASSSDLHALDAIVEPVASCYTAGDTIGAGIIGADHLRAGGIHRMVIVPRHEPRAHRSAVGGGLARLVDRYHRGRAVGVARPACRALHREHQADRSVARSRRPRLAHRAAESICILRPAVVRSAGVAQTVEGAPPRRYRRLQECQRPVRSRRRRRRVDCGGHRVAQRVPSRRRRVPHRRRRVCLDHRRVRARRRVVSRRPSRRGRGDGAQRFRGVALGRHVRAATGGHGQDRDGAG